jgi:hypothetical protein
LITEPRPIFIVGTPRSGTTLASRILGRHPEVHAAGETHFFEDVWANRNTFGTLKAREEIAAAVSRLLTVFDRFNQVEGQALVDRLIRPDDLIALTLEYGGGYDRLYRAFTESLDEHGNGLRYCDDTPKHLFYLKSILDFFPQARIIICTLDPRDFLCSYKNFWRASRTPERIKALYHPIITSLLWRRSADILINDPLVQQSTNIMTLPYETLVAEPELHVKRLCHFTGLDYDDSLIAIDSHNSSFDQSEDGIYQGSVGKWQACLSPKEAWWVQRINRTQMKKLGYETADISVSPLMITKILLSTPAALLRALKANNGRRGPLLPYLLKRIFPGKLTTRQQNRSKSQKVDGLAK